jgi:hypothetical protein
VAGSTIQVNSGTALRAFRLNPIHGLGVHARPQVVLGSRLLAARLAGKLLDESRGVLARRSSDAMHVHLELAGLGVDREFDLWHGGSSVPDPELDQAALVHALHAGP